MNEADRVRAAGAFRRALVEGDVEQMMAAWREVYGHLPQPANEAEGLVIMHRARAEAECVPLAKRIYSHHWLTERGYPSGLPDHLKPKAERIYPRIVEAVGISVNFPRMFKWAEKLVERAMCDAVEDCYADGRTDPDYVSRAMMAARERKMAELLGRSGQANVRTTSIF